MCADMSARGGQPGLSVGDVLSGLGAVVLLVSLWRPWYELRFPDEVIAQARAFSSRLGELGPFAQQGLDELQEQGAVPVTAWQVFDQADAMLAAAAGVVLGLVLLNAVGALAARQDTDPDPGRRGGHGAGGPPAGQPAGP